MKLSNRKATLVYVFAILIMIFAGWQMHETPVKADEGLCCTYGEDCPGAYPNCWLPRPGEADCSATKKNYCKADENE